MKTNPFGAFIQARSEEALEQFRQQLVQGGFTPFRLFLEGFREKLKAYEDGEMEDVAELITLAKRLFPVPAQFSPSWAQIWEEFELTASYKNTVLESIAAADREGEWQILIDNPYTNSDLVCYPSLEFLDAAYLYGYFRTDLKNNEYIRLQKIQNVMMVFGSEQTVQGSRRA